MRFARPFFSSRAFNVNIFREQISGREYPPLSPFPIPFLCFPTYSRSIRSSRSSIPSHSRGSVFRFTRFRPFCESALLKEESTHENRSLGSADLFHVALALDNVLCLFIDLAAGREITEPRSLCNLVGEVLRFDRRTKRSVNPCES